MAKSDKSRVTRISFNLDRPRDIANIGVKRAALFMGLGLHAAYREDFQDYLLHKLPAKDGQVSIPVEILPIEARREIVDQFKAEFAVWITGCGLREMLEHYALALDEIHKGAILILHIRSKIPREKLDKLHNAFHRIPGLPRKLSELEKRSGITPMYRAHIDSLYKARNCLTHGAGVVTPTYFNDIGALRLKWRALEVFAQDPKGQGELIGRQMFGVTFPAGGEINIRKVEREKAFKLGEHLHLSQQDLWEICTFFAYECIPSLLDSTLAFAEKHGIKINRLPERD
jgi:hypothetical protein